MADSPTPQQRTITIRTRRRISEILGSRSYRGALSDEEFLSRLYDLHALPSHDLRYRTAAEDIHKHCILNNDWKNNWIFGDRRFQLDNGPDIFLLRFLAEMLHPDVRDANEAALLAQDLNTLLANDGWELVQQNKHGRHAIYIWREHQTSRVTSAPGFPMHAETFVEALIELVSHRGADNIRSLLPHSEYIISRASYDNWDGGITGWGLVCACPTALYVRLSEEQRTVAETTVSSAATEILRAYPKHHIDHVVISPRATAPHKFPPAATDNVLLNSADTRPIAEPRPRNFEYDVALSFAGEDRSHAEAVATLLKSNGRRVFYDLYEQADLWGKDLYQHLQTVYRDKAQFCIIFVSADYVRKAWPRHELRQAQARAFTEHAEYILPVYLDETPIPGLNSTVGYLDGRTHDAAAIVAMLLRKLEEPSTT